MPIKIEELLRDAEVLGQAPLEADAAGTGGAG